MRKQPKQVLRDFYEAYADWLDNGAPEGRRLDRSCGLCMCLWRWGRASGLPDDLVCDASNLMDDQFKAARLNVIYPFNLGLYDFSTDSSKREHHLNPDRIKWVRARFAEAE